MTLLYVSAKSNDGHQLNKVRECVKDIRCWIIGVAVELWQNVSCRQRGDGLNWQVMRNDSHLCVTNLPVCVFVLSIRT